MTRVLSNVAAGLLILTVLTAMPAQAVPIQFEIVAQNNTGDVVLNNAIPDGEVVNFSFVIDVPAGNPASVGTFDAVNGSVTWNNGGSQSFVPTAAGKGGGSAFPNYVELFLNGSPTVIGTTAINGFFFKVEIAENPFSTTEELSDLLLAGTVLDMGLNRELIGVEGGTNELDLISASISPGVLSDVPEPTAIVLLAFGLAGIGATKRYRETYR